MNLKENIKKSSFCLGFMNNYKDESGVIEQKELGGCLFFCFTLEHTLTESSISKILGLC